MLTSNNEIDSPEFILSLNANEWRIVAGCLRESFAAIGKQEYALRIGASMDEVQVLNEKIRTHLKEHGLKE